MAKEEPQEADLGDYTDYLLLSSSDLTQGWRHNIMRLAPASASETTDVRHWTEAKLNRRDMQRVRREEAELARKAAETARAEAEAAAARENGADAGGMEVELKPGMPGYMAAQIKKEEEARDQSKVAPAPAADPSKKAPSKPRGGFGAPKKTRRIFITDESTKERRLRFEERHPWVLETEDDKKPPNETRWIGKMDSSTSSAAGEGSSYVCLVLDPHSAGSEAAFKVVPANRWYKFTSRPKYHTLSAEEAEAEYEKMQKAGDLDIWFSQRRTNTGVSNSSGLDTSTARASRGPDSFMAAGTAGPSGGYRNRFALARGVEAEQLPPTRMKTVYGNRRLDDDLFEDTQTAGPSGRGLSKSGVRTRRREDNEGDEREDFEFEEDFQDDEEGIGQVGDDALDAEENRQLEERMKREMRDANTFGDGVEADDEEAEAFEAQLTKAGKRMKRILKKRGRRRRKVNNEDPDEDDEDDEEEDDDDDDDDDDLKNPYATDEEQETDSEEEREKQAKTQQSSNGRFTATQPPPMSRNASLASGPKYPGGSSGPSRSTSSGPPGSRGGSPVPTISQLSQRAASPSGSRPGSRAASPTPPPSATKRKAEDGGNSPTEGEKAQGTAGSGLAASTSSKRRKPGSPSPAPSPGPTTGEASALIAREEIVAFIRERAPTTKELLRHFKAAMSRDPRNREVILQVTKEVAAIADGKLSLKPNVA